MRLNDFRKLLASAEKWTLRKTQDVSRLTYTERRPFPIVAKIEERTAQIHLCLGWQKAERKKWARSRFKGTRCPYSRRQKSILRQTYAGTGFLLFPESLWRTSWAGAVIEVSHLFKSKLSRIGTLVSVHSFSYSNALHQKIVTDTSADSRQTREHKPFRCVWSKLSCNSATC